MSVKFSTQIDADVLKDIKLIAQKDGRKIGSLVTEALADYVEKKNSITVRENVLKAYQKGADKYRDTLKSLA